MLPCVVVHNLSCCMRLPLILEVQQEALARFELLGLCWCLGQDISVPHHLEGSRGMCKTVKPSFICSAEFCLNYFLY